MNYWEVLLSKKATAFEEINIILASAEKSVYKNEKCIWLNWSKYLYFFNLFIFG